MASEEPRDTEIERRLTTILAADVVGYSRLVGMDEEATVSALRAALRDSVDPRIAAHRGRLIKTLGDGILVEFPSVVDAVRAAIALQIDMTERGKSVPPDRRLVFRIGINLGDVIVEGEDLLGDGVNIAARLESAAEPGGILLSEDAYRQVAGKVEAEFLDGGERELKNIAHPVRVYRVRAAGMTPSPPAPISMALPRQRWVPLASGLAALVLVAALAIAWLLLGPGGTPNSTSSGQPSIVVLPFNNLTGDRQQGYLADGITENLTTALSRIPSLMVIARNTAYAFKDTPVDLRKLGQELNVRYVLEGSVQQSTDRIRINAQLIDAASGAHLWADSFDKPRGDLLALEDEVVARLARSLDVEVTLSASRFRIGAHGSPDALDYVMRARAASLALPSAAQDRIQEELYEKALALDPQMPAAQAGLAAVLADAVISQWSRKPEADLKRASELADAVLAANPNYYLAHYAKGAVLRVKRDLAGAIAEYRQALDLNPNATQASAALGRVLSTADQPEEAIRLIEHAMRLSPRDPLMTTWRFWLGFAELMVGQDRKAAAALQQSLDDAPARGYIYPFLAAAYELSGDRAAALRAMDAGRAVDPHYLTIKGTREDLESLSSDPKFLARFDRVFEALRRLGASES